MAHDDNVVSGDASAAEIEREIQCNKRLAETVTSDEEKTAFLEERRRLGEAIKNVVFTFYEDELGNCESEKWYNDDGEISRVGAPAIVRYETNGLSKSEEWFVDGKQHRLDGPAVIFYYTREDNTAMHIIKQETWYINGEIQRDDGGPAIRCYYEDGSINVERWLVSGQQHRVDGPAISAHYDNGNPRYEVWFQHGETHREDGPAVVSYYTNGEVAERIWYNHGVRRS